MELGRAIQIYAQYVVASECDRAEWENYPDIGENDWLRVLNELPDFPEPRDMREAEVFLVGRVSNDEFGGAGDA